MDNDHSCLKKSVTTTPTTVHKKDPEFYLLRFFFSWLSPDIIRRSFQHTTQCAHLLTGTTFNTPFKSSNPTLNGTNCNEPVACDIVYADMHAIDDGFYIAIFFNGTDTQLT